MMERDQSISVVTSDERPKCIFNEAQAPLQQPPTGHHHRMDVINNISDYMRCEKTSDVVLDVAAQIAEKLSVTSPVTNGCVNAVNGLTRLDDVFYANNCVNCEDDDEETTSPSQEKCDSGIKCYSSSSSTSSTSSANCVDMGHSLPVIYSGPTNNDTISYIGYESELQMPDIMRLIQKDLSEPYSIYTYRYFIHNWPKLCFLAMDSERCVGAVVCKLDLHKRLVRRGYIAMLAVDENYRKRKIGSNLVLKAIRAMVADNADEVVLETEITNKPALRLYENLGFVRDKRLFRYYLNGVDALRLKLWLR
uniref:N-terminal methionine N(alpha)-acetyltransferase NatC n=1 Tax=Strigamia maritima TaxID=126957 RepID=T1IML4_STRMM